MKDMPEPDTINAEWRVEDPVAPYVNEFHAYAVSKVKALNAAEAWMATKKPGFDMICILPTGVIGRNDLALKPEDAVSGTNAWVLRPLLGMTAPATLPGATVHNDDVARLHVEALQKGKIPPGAYIGSSNSPVGSLAGSKLEDATIIIAKLFPDAIWRGLVPNNGLQKSFSTRIDTSKTEDTFGWPLRGFEEQVKSVVGHYLELLSKG